MAIAYLDPDGGGQFDKLSQKAEALLRRKRQEREEEIRREQRKADAEIVRAAVGVVRDLLCLHFNDMSRPGGGGTQTAISQERFAKHIADALADALEGK